MASQTMIDFPLMTIFREAKKVQKPVVEYAVFSALYW